MKTMIVETIVGVLSTNKTAQISNTLISLEAGSGQLALKQQLKVSKFRKQNTKFSHPPKNQRNFVHFLP